MHNIFIRYRVHAMKIDPLPTFHKLQITQASVTILLNCVYVT